LARVWMDAALTEEEAQERPPRPSSPAPPPVNRKSNRLGHYFKVALSTVRKAYPSTQRCQAVRLPRGGAPPNMYVGGRRRAADGPGVRCSSYSRISNSFSHLTKECAAAWASSRLFACSIPCKTSSR